jgi:hypothetical protein
MTEALTGTKLAGAIEKIVTTLPDNHDQGYWFYSYETPDHYAPVDPESIELVQIKDAVLADKLEETEVKCNTTFCTAGWACILNGYKLARVTDSQGYTDEVAVDKNGQEHNIADLAAQLLDISYDVSNTLFDGDTSNDKAADILGALAEGNYDEARDLALESSRCDCGCGGSDEDEEY